MRQKLLGMEREGSAPTRELGGTHQGVVHVLKREDTVVCRSRRPQAEGTKEAA